jgi:hypothetical protein
MKSNSQSNIILNDEIKKKIDSTGLTCQTLNLSHEKGIDNLIKIKSNVEGHETKITS